MSIRYSLSILPVLLVTSTLVGHAPAVSADGAVYACASKYFGFLRLVKKPKCRRRERLVTFPAASGNGGGEGNADLLARIESLESQNTELRTRIDDLQEDHQDDSSAFTDRLDGLVLEDTRLGDAIGDLQDADAVLTAQVEGSTGGVQPILPDKLACISDASTATDLIFEGCNVHIRNGGDYSYVMDGTGNLIIGYNEDGAGTKARTGSHNLVIGEEHEYLSYGGLVAGYGNTVSEANASVTGGSMNTASGPKSSVSGGQGNQALAEFSSVSGGASNTVPLSGRFSSISGGGYNQAEGVLSSISGGAGNQTALGEYGSVSGGLNNMALGYHSSILGGDGAMISGSGEIYPQAPPLAP